MALSLSLSFPLLASAGQAPAQAASDAPPQLVTGAPVERELKGGETHAYTITLAAGDLLDAVVEQRGVDVAVRVVAPDGAKALAVDSPNGPNGPEPVLFVAPVAGTYRIEVSSLEPNAGAGRYQITLRAKGPAPAAMTPKRIGAGIAIDGRIVGVGVDLYEVELQEGQVLDAVAEQKRADVVLRLRAPNGALVEEVDSPNGLNGPERLWYAARAGGVYRIEVASIEDWNHGSYVLKVNGIRLPTDGERMALEAMRLDDSAEAMRSAGRADEATLARRRATELYASQIALGLPIQRAIGGEPDDYAIELGQDSLVEMLVEQKGVDVVVRLFDPAGEKVAEVDSPNGTSGFERLRTIVKDPGAYRFEVVAPEKGAVGRYIVRSLELRGATERDRTIVEIRARFDAGVRLAIEKRTAESVHEFERALQLHDSVYGREGNPQPRSILINLALELAELGDSAKARDVYLRLLAASESTFGPGHPAFAGDLNDAANQYFNCGDYAKAESLALRALQIYERHYGPDHGKVGAASITVGNVYVSEGEFEKAEAYTRRALEIFEKTEGPDSSDTSLAVGNLGIIFRMVQRYDLAESMLRRAIAIDEKMGRIKCSTMANLCSNLGEVIAERGDRVGAEPFFKRSIDITESLVGPEHPALIAPLLQLAGLAWSRHDVGGALVLFRRADWVLERHISAGLEAGSEREKGLLVNLHLRDDDLYLSFALADQRRDPDAVRLALKAVLRGKGHVLDVAAESISTLRSHASDKDRALLDKLAATRSEVSRRILGGAGGSELAAHLADIARLEEQAEQLERDIFVRSGALRSKASPITCEAVQATIPDGAALVEIVRFEPLDAALHSVGPDRYCAIVLERRGDPHILDLGEAGPIDEAARVLRTALRDPRRRDARALARALDEKVVRPVRSQLGPDTRKLLLSPDGELNLVPFAALVDEENRYLVEQYTISYLTSGRDLLRPDRPSAGADTALVVANPDFGLAEAPASAADSARRAFDVAAMRFRAIPGTEQEAREIGALLPKATVLTGDRATVEAIRQARSPRVLHIATHGFFLENAVTSAAGTTSEPSAARIESPLLRSGLALAGANRRASPKDGLLTAFDAAGLDLWGTELVVLSACDTGLGEVRAGEGVYGLRRALVLAGSETQVMSLWDVDDGATRELMVAYYKELLAGAGRAEAMRRVQRHMLKDPMRRHPAFWASFIVSGDWRPLN